MKPVNIGDELHKQLKIRAAKEERDIRLIVEEALKQYLTRSKKRS